MEPSEATVFVVDDNLSVLKSLTRLLTSVGYRVEAFASGRDYLNRALHPGPSCLVLDVRMPGMSGLYLQEKLNSSGHGIPIIFITGHGSVTLSVKAMKAGAVDFIEKPFEDQTLLDAVNEAVERDRRAKTEQAELYELKRRRESLTPREQEVFMLVVSGLINKKIAAVLGTSEKTIKVHRARVMDKMRAQSLADLVRMAEKVI